ncbi:MAG: hypothetical protein AAF267_02520 [Deinococcota bacterium]
MSEDLEHYSYRGARAMILLHERHMRTFVATWREAKAAGVRLPETADTDYVSLETLLRHNLQAAKGYMVWMCETLELPDPEITDAPAATNIEQEADAFLEHMFERWRLPLADVPEAAFDTTHTSGWGVAYCVDGMLEHAVMHPIRHEFQLRNLIDEQTNR